jgi:hypothetical protein
MRKDDEELLKRVRKEQEDGLVLDLEPDSDTVDAIVKGLIEKPPEPKARGKPLLEKDKPNGDSNPEEYRRKSTVEQQVGDPLRSLEKQLIGLSHQIETTTRTAEENYKRDEEATRKRHKEFLCLTRVNNARQTRHNWITAALSGGTIAVLVATYCVYNRQAGIMRRQAVIMETQREKLAITETPQIAVSGKLDSSMIFLTVTNTGHSPATNVCLSGADVLEASMNVDTTDKVKVADNKVNSLLQEQREALEKQHLPPDEIKKELADATSAFRNLVAEEERATENVSYCASTVAAGDSAILNFAHVVGPSQMFELFGSLQYNFTNPAVQSVKRPFCVQFFNSVATTCLTLRTK